MKVKRVLGLILVTLVPICFPAVSSASVYYSLTDTTTGAGYGTTYSLEVFSLGGSNYRAMLTADTTFNSGWYIDWFAIKFDGGTAGDITSPIVGPGPAGTWLEGTGVIDLQKYTDFPNNTWTGAYVAGVVDPATAINQGAALNDSIHNWVFDFTLSTPFNPNPSFQVGYYGPNAGGSENISFNRLSQSFQVPEPSTILLLGSGILGLALYRRGFRK